MIPLNIIVAVDKKFGIGKNGVLPWHIPYDLKHFKDITTSTKSSDKKNVVLMGRKTWESLPEKFKPLPDRVNLVLSRSKTFAVPEGVCLVNSFDDAVSWVRNVDSNVVEQAFVTGGAEIFYLASQYKICKRLYVTHIDYDYDCDVKLPLDFLSGYSVVSKNTPSVEGDISFYFCEYQLV
ncbi:MAG: dihydrofolate reductase [Victivallaceae bacterium]|nr:dihydrofolate reductase [Victivallaceae bacterium]